MTTAIRTVNVLDVDTDHLRWLVGRERAVTHLAIHADSVSPWLDRLEGVLDALDHARGQLANYGLIAAPDDDWVSDHPGGHIDQAIQLANSHS